MKIQLWSELWRADDGFVISSEFVLMATLVGIGIVVGVTTCRDQFIQEFGDAAISVGNMNQSYSFAGVVGGIGTIAGSEYNDLSDFCDVQGIDIPGRAPACISLQFKSGPFGSQESNEE